MAKWEIDRQGLWTKLELPDCAHKSHHTDAWFAVLLH
jgi:hypothetical protein